MVMVGVIQVTSPYGNNYHHGDQVDSGNFAFTAAEAGDYTTCFTAPDHKPETTVAIEFEWKTGVAAMDWSKIAKKEQVEVSDCFGLYFLFNLTFYDNLFIKFTPVYCS
jgi:hypothetical protein